MTKSIWIGTLAVACACSVPSAPAENPYVESFDLVWQTVEERFYDPELNGVDWQTAREEYRPRIRSAGDDETFYRLINSMLFDLGVSHLGVVPTDDPEQLGEATIFAEATVGLDVRFVEGDLRVVEVEPGSAAHREGIRLGDRIDLINGRTIQKIGAERLSFPAPPDTERHRRYMVLDSVDWGLLGSAREAVSIVFEDRWGRTKEATLQRQPRGARAVFEPGLPPTYVSLTARRIEDRIGYLRFNCFHPELLDEMLAAVDRFADTEGLIVDLRGNPGGAFHVRRRLAAQFVREPTLIWRYRGRDGTDEVVLEPDSDPYVGELVVLVDGMSASSSEEFAGGLQTLGRATVVGERTVGKVLVQEVMELPLGAYFVLPVAETRTANDAVLERNGVTPNVRAHHTLASLRAGEDAQLSAAIEVLTRNERSGGRVNRH